MEITQLFLISVGVMLLCCLAMAVGLILRNKTFTSCACASITYKGEKIRCPACPEEDETDTAS